MTEGGKTILNLGLTALVSAGTNLLVNELSDKGADRSASVGGSNVDVEVLKAQLKEALYNEWLIDPIVQNRLRGLKGDKGDTGANGPTDRNVLSNFNVNASSADDTPFLSYNLINGKKVTFQASADGNHISLYFYDGISWIEVIRYNSNGTVSKIGGGSFAALSDERVKDNIEDFTNGLATILAIQTKSFKYKKVVGTQTEFYPDFICEKTQYGVIAQQLREVCPEMVTEGENGFLSVDLSNLNLMLVNAVKELDKKDKAQQTLITQQKNRIDALETAQAGILSRLEALEAPQA